MKPATALPTIDDHPNADVVLFDGKCVFCTAGVRQLHWLDGQNRLAFLSLHDPRVEKRFPDLTQEQLMAQMYVIPNSQPNMRHGGAEAIRYLSWRLPKLWLVAPLLHIPFSMPVWQWFYNFVARHRYRIANKYGNACDDDGTCELHHRE